MLFVALLKPRDTTTFQEGVARRMQWDYPEGVRVLGEYWFETETPSVISIMEAQSMDVFGQIRMYWGDMFEIEVFPAILALALLALSHRSAWKGSPSIPTQCPPRSATARRSRPLRRSSPTAASYSTRAS